MGIYSIEDGKWKTIELFHPNIAGINWIPSWCLTYEFNGSIELFEKPDQRLRTLAIIVVRRLGDFIFGR